MFPDVVVGRRGVSMRQGRDHMLIDRTQWKQNLPPSPIL